MTTESQAEGRKASKASGIAKDGYTKPRPSANGTSTGRLTNIGSNMNLLENNFGYVGGFHERTNTVFSTKKPKVSGCQRSARKTRETSSGSKENINSVKYLKSGHRTAAGSSSFIREVSSNTKSFRLHKTANIYD